MSICMRWTNASIALSHRHAVVPCRLSFSCVRWQSSKAAPESPPTPRPSPSPDRPITHFGFQSIPTEEKESLVRSVFSSVAGSYDTMNDVMSLGIHRLWKDTLITRMGPGPQTRLLDVAGGTGDIAFRFLKAANGKDAVVNVVDINPDMLQVGRNRALQMGFSHDQISFQEGNAESLTDIPSNSMDIYTIAFGVRNCTHIDRVLKEAYRVLKPGGRFMCLEFSAVDVPVLKELYDAYSFHVIPGMGKAIANDEDSYRYLVESIRKFPTQPKFAQMISEAGFEHVAWENLTLGVAAIHSGFKMPPTLKGPSEEAKSQ